MFFDDILIYSKSEMDHIEHLKKVFEVLKANQLAVKREKCEFERRDL